MSSWTQLKENIYYQDGSLRDLYIHDTNLSDWKKWVAFVNESYRTAFFVYETETTTEKIDIEVVEKFWSGEKDYGCTATIFIGDILVKCYFFTIENIENDITPKEMCAVSDHEELAKYMCAVSSLLNKTVTLTAENDPETILMSAIGNQLILNM